MICGARLIMPGFYFSPEKEKVPLPVDVGRSKMLK